MEQQDRPGLVVAARTDVGHVRERNEDCVVVAGTVIQAERDEMTWDGDDLPVLLAVLDGLGGHPDGDVASRRAGRALAEAADPLDVDAAVQGAHEAVLAAIEAGSGGGDGGREMGTTVALAVVSENEVVVASVGDSPALLVDDGLELLTEPDRGVFGGLTSFLGVPGADELAPHVRRLRRDRPLRLLLATDGLSDVVPGDDAHAAATGGSPADAAAALVRSALERGARDNVTVVVADVAASRRTDGPA